MSSRKPDPEETDPRRIVVNEILGHADAQRTDSPDRIKACWEHFAAVHGADAATVASAVMLAYDLGYKRGKGALKS
jgi:hypothetical protein